MFRKTIKALLFLCSAAFTFGTAQAAPDPGINFHPTQSWIVGTAHEKDASGFQGCAIQNEFNNGFVIRLDGDQAVGGLSINFRQSLFTPGETQQLSLAVPGVAELKVNATAASDMVLQTGLQGNEAFYKAMRTSGVLDVALEQNSFRFYLVGFDSAAQQFETCMAQGGGSAPEKMAAQATPAAGTEDTSKLPDTVNESIALEQEMTGQQTAPAPVQEILPAEDKQAPADMAAGTQGSDTDEQTQKLIEDLKEFSSQPETQSAQSAAITQTPSQEALSEPKPEISTEKTEIPAEKNDGIKVSKQTTKIEADLTQGMDRPSEKTLAEQEKMAEEKITRRSDPEMARKISELESQLHKVKKENNSLSQELASSLKEGRDERISISSDNWNLERATMRFNESERQLKTLGIQLQKERAQCAVEKKDLEAMLFDPQVTNQQQLARLADLEGKLAEAQQQLADQRLRYEEQIRILQGKK